MYMYTITRSPHTVNRYVFILKMFAMNKQLKLLHLSPLLSIISTKTRKEIFNSPLVFAKVKINLVFAQIKIQITI